MALPRGESGAKSRPSTSSTATPSSFARAASRRGVRSVRVVPGCTQFTVIPQRPSWGASVAAQVPVVARVGAADVDDAPPPLRLHVGDDRAGAAQRAHVLHVEVL